jgi:hypothetical protein
LIPLLARADDRVRQPEERARSTRPRTFRVVSLGAVMLARVGAFNVLDGIVAQTNPTGFHEGLLFSNPTRRRMVRHFCGGIRFLSGVAVLQGRGVRDAAACDSPDRASRPDDLRPALVDAVEDAAVQVVFPVDDETGWVDAAGEVVQSPPPGAERCLTEVRECERLVAGVVQDEALRHEHGRARR